MAQLAAARKRHDELTRGAAAEEARIAELHALVEATEGFRADEEQALRDERERLRHVTELAEGAARAVERSRRRTETGRQVLAAAAERALAPLERLAPERVGEGCATSSCACAVGSDLHAFLASLEAEPDRLDHVEGELERIADARRRFGASGYGDLLAPAPPPGLSCPRSRTGSTSRRRCRRSPRRKPRRASSPRRSAPPAGSPPVPSRTPSPRLRGVRDG